MLSGQCAAAEFWLQCAKQRYDETIFAENPVSTATENADPTLDFSKESGERDTLGEIFALDAYLAVTQGNIQGGIRSATQALHYISEESAFLRSNVALILGIAYFSQGEVLPASQAFSEAEVPSRSLGNSYLTVLILCSLALTQAAQGHLHLAAETYQQALRHARQEQKQPAPYAGIAHIGLAGIHYE